ncbi:hypothetical protein ACH5RR_008336 [Cinchona calisaya]|uniref:Uncharacterized protein n=1 Tax=Cinchona calisaya TaxID=153742 RepID=A0ABD3ABG7_9GENT
MMDLWQKMVFPVRRVWFGLSSRVKARKNGGGLLKLRDDIQTCGYEDVQVMWEMLRRTESELISRHNKLSKATWAYFNKVITHDDIPEQDMDGNRHFPRAAHHVVQTILLTADVLIQFVSVPWDSKGDEIHVVHQEFFLQLT